MWLFYCRLSSHTLKESGNGLICDQLSYMGRRNLAGMVTFGFTKIYTYLTN